MSAVLSSPESDQLAPTRPPGLASH